jgi:hypothetical protein
LRMLRIDHAGQFGLGQGGHLDRKTLGLVRLELQALPDEYVGDLPAAVQSYWRDLHNEAIQTSKPTYRPTATVAAHEERMNGVNPNYEEYRIEQLNQESEPANGVQTRRPKPNSCTSRTCSRSPGSGKSI